MALIDYDATRESLFYPGNADNFFQIGHIRNDADLCAEMSRLAYVREIDRLKTYLARGGFKLDLNLWYEENDTQLFIASKLDGSLTIVSFRGTEKNDPSDLFTDAKFPTTSWLDASGNIMGQVHSGFVGALIEKGYLKRIMDVLNSVPVSTRILITGHSLGAALATLAASWKQDAVLYTFGSPLVGDKDFAKAMNAVKQYRYVDCCDMVTCLPPAFWGYVHSGTLRYLDRNGQLIESPTEDEISHDRTEAELWYLRKVFQHGIARNLADHTPINYLSGVMGLRNQV
jgi:hypothetical protein